MGNNNLRRMLKQECKWTDKIAPKHKHNFCVHALLQMRNIDNIVEYYDIMKCDKCNSFHSIPRTGAINGFISNNDSINWELPTLKLYRSHRYTIGFNDAILDDLEKE